MPKFGKGIWFLLLLLGLVAVVSLAAAQERPQAAGGQLMQEQPLAVSSLAESAAETQIQISTTARHALDFPSASLDLSPAAAAQEPAATTVPLDRERQDKALTGAASPDRVELSPATRKSKVDFAGRFLGLPQPAPSPSAAGATCTQLLGNPQLTAGSGGSIAPWVVLEPRVYFSSAEYVSPPHSLLFEDNDADDASPTVDAFAQAFSTPANLTQVIIEYNTASLDSNAADETWGNIYTVDAGGNLDEFLIGWEIGQSPDAWQTQTLTINNAGDLALLEGQDLVIIFFNSTNGSAPGEVVFFDDITFTACAEETPESFIIVKKQTNPSSATQQFTFDPSWSGSNFQLGNGQSKKSPALAPGTYNVQEVVPSGWKLTSATCDDGSSPNNISLQAGETVTCTFRNTKDAFIRVRKETTPGGVSQKFTFDPSWSGSNFQLSDGQVKKSGVLTPGNYSVEEVVPSGWKLDSVSCSDGSTPNNISLQAGETVTCTFRNVQESKAESCSQLLVNTQLNIVEFGDGTGTAEPWSVLAPIVYYTKNPDVAFDGYSLFLEDGDDGDPSPQWDIFAQGFQMPAKPTQFSIEYKRATLNSNAADEVYGELWLLDENWVLDLDDPTTFVMGWPVNESEAVWGTDSGTWNDPALLNKLSGRKAAILLYNSTDGGGSKQEIVLFDDVTLSACTKSAPTSGRVLMPTILNNYGTPSGPLCLPPTENPADQWYADRGLVQTGAACNSSLSNVDIADYYTFRPSKSGNHTLRLSNLPAGTEWAAMIFFDQAEPDYAPGGAGDGTCRITDPGSQPKQVVCNLDQNKDYFVKVSSGSTPQAGTYTMRITGP